MRRFLLSLSRIYKVVARLSLLLRGRTPASHAARRVVTGRTWEDFCDTLKGAGASIIGHGDAIDLRTQAEGYRYLSRLVRAGLEAFVEYADPCAPALRRMVHETVKMGADNPDNYYMNAVVSGAYEYRIVGTRGTVHFLCFSTQKGGYGQGGDMPPTGFLDSRDLEVSADGMLEIAVSCEKREGNWLSMEPDTGLIVVRQTFLDRTAEVPAELTIERVGGDGLPMPLGAEEIEKSTATSWPRPTWWPVPRSSSPGGSRTSSGTPTGCPASTRTSRPAPAGTRRSPTTTATGVCRRTRP